MKGKRKRYKYRINKFSNWRTMLLTEDDVKREIRSGCEFWIGSQTSFLDPYGRIKKEKL